MLEDVTAAYEELGIILLGFRIGVGGVDGEEKGGFLIDVCLGAFGHFLYFAL